jgi:hypothetical protein
LFCDPSNIFSCGLVETANAMAEVSTAEKGEAPAHGVASNDEKSMGRDAASDAVEDGKLVTAPGMHTDIAYDLYIESLTMDPEHRARLANKVKRKLDMIVLPAV